MQELIQIRIEELSRLRHDLIEKQKKDLAKIEVRINELQELFGKGVPLTEGSLDTDIPFDEDDQMVLEDSVFVDAEPIVLPLPKTEKPPEPVASTYLNIPPILQNVVVAPSPTKISTSTAPTPASAEAAAQDDIEALINGLV